MAKRRVLKVGDIVLGKYKILELIHTGGMSNVYLVRDTGLRKNWCLKEIVHAKQGDDEKMQLEYRSLIREANIMKDLNSPGIPRITAMESDEDSTFIIMDYVDGYSIKDWMIKKNGFVDQDTTVAWIAQVCQVLIYLHTKNPPIFYRDLKPENIMVKSDGSVQLIDFGISVVMDSDVVYPDEAAGTKGYSPPEQYKKKVYENGEVVDEYVLPCDLRSDIFALGRTMYSMLSGIDLSTLPREERDKLIPIREWNPSVSVELESIINKCIEINPDDRYQSVEEVLQALQNMGMLNEEHRERIRKKVITTITLMVAGFLFSVLSIIPYGMGKSQTDSEYLYLVSAAEQSGRASDYEKAIEKKPDNLAPYIGYIDSLKTDGVFDKNEETNLLNLINPVLSKVKEKSEYKELAYEIGKLYWFYYDDTLDNCMNLSTKWFKDAIDGGYREEESEIFYNLGNFKKNIAKYITEAEDKGLYKDYWEDLMQAKGYNSGEIVEIQINLAIVDAINSYAYRLKADGIPTEEMISELNRINDYLNDVVPSSEKSEEMFNDLKSAYESISASTKKELGISAEGVSEEQDSTEEMGGDS